MNQPIPQFNLDAAATLRKIVQLQTEAERGEDPLSGRADDMAIDFIWKHLSGKVFAVIDGEIHRALYRLIYGLLKEAEQARESTSAPSAALVTGLHGKRVFAMSAAGLWTGILDGYDGNKKSVYLEDALKLPAVLHEGDVTGNYFYLGAPVDPLKTRIELVLLTGVTYIAEDFRGEPIHDGKQSPEAQRQYLAGSARQVPIEPWKSATASDFTFNSAGWFFKGFYLAESFEKAMEGMVERQKRTP